MNSKHALIPVTAVLLFAVFSVSVSDTIQNVEASGDKDKKKYRDRDRDYDRDRDRQYQESKYGNDRYGDYNGDRHSKVFVAKLNGDSQIPPRDTPAKGFATIKIIKNPESEEKELWYKVELSNVPDDNDISAIHLHAIENPNGSGPHVVTLCGFPTNELGCPEGPGIVVAGSVRDGDHPAGDIEPHGDVESLQDIIELLKQGMIYVNVHSSDFNNEGEIRGVLHPKNY